MQRFLPWLLLKSVPGIGCLLAKRLIDRFGSPEGIFSADDRLLQTVDGITPRVIEGIRNARECPDMYRELERASERGVRILVLTDPEYPPLLREIADPPIYLYCLGNPGAISPAVAVVGSRHATSYGVTITHRMASDLARHGITIVSGLARGIDTAAHEGALMGQGRTAAVLGSGLNRVYPAENQRLFDRIIEQGCVFSEFPLDAGPDAFHFPMRNRIISGLCLGTLVVEASKNSGSLITARLALEQNRDVFAVPGNIQSFKSTGTHTLIKSGAKLVEHVGDILEELQLEALGIGRSPPAASFEPPVELGADERLVVDHLSVYPMQMDEIVRKTRMPSGKLAAVLLRLELKGLCRKNPGNQYALCRAEQGNLS